MQNICMHNFHIYNFNTINIHECPKMHKLLNKLWHEEQNSVHLLKITEYRYIL